MPVYYRTLPGNTPDSRSLATILADLKNAGFKEIVMITDRGYESIRNLEMYIDKGQSMITGTKTGSMSGKRLTNLAPSTTILKGWRSIRRRGSTSSNTSWNTRSKGSVIM